ncbi:MAG: hypothetical protein FWF05_08300 [Oscillospiraceae bacterium]|nr:hypothetical protein [Oscillospiraceae bacterium]
MKKALTITLILIAILIAMFAFIAYNNRGGKDDEVPKLTTQAIQDGHYPDGEESTAGFNGGSDTWHGGTDEPTTQDDFEPEIGEYLQRYLIEPIQAENFTMSANLSGVKTTLTKSGSNSAMSMDVSMDGLSLPVEMPSLMSMKIIVKDDVVYMVMPMLRKYTVVSAEEYAQNNLDTMDVQELTKVYGDVKLIETKTVTKDRKEYTVETYVKRDGSVESYYFSDKGLEFLEVIMDEQPVLSELSISSKVDSKAFDIPWGYRKVDVENLLSGLSDIFPTKKP